MIYLGISFYNAVQLFELMTNAKLYNHLDFFCNHDEKCVEHDNLLSACSTCSAFLKMVIYKDKSLIHILQMKLWQFF
jgi:hypothetical protein